MITFTEFFNAVFDFEDDKLHAERDHQLINQWQNTLQRRPIRLARKRRKGQILKRLHNNINPYLKQFLDFKNTKYAIQEQRIWDIDPLLWNKLYGPVNKKKPVDVGC